MMMRRREFRTTMLCRVCHEKMQTRKKRQSGTGRVVEDHDFRECTHCGTQASPTLRSRDGNAACNILFTTWVNLAGLEMPSALKRPAKKDEAVAKQASQSVGRRNGRKGGASP
jgi:hypothetical protein